MKKILAVLLAVLTCFCFAGCELVNKILRWGATVPPSYAPCTTYYGVVQKGENSELGDGLFVYIDGVGLCDIPTYAKEPNFEVSEGDVLVMDFYFDEVLITENYPQGIATPVGYMAVVEFSFSLTWNTFGISSYDSKTSKLVKTKDAPSPEDYITTHVLTAQEKIEIFKILQALEMDSYPDEYNPTEGIGSVPYQELILSAQLDGITKTITADQVALGDATSEKGQKFMDACKKIADILENTDEWKALPDYPYLYD